DASSDSQETGTAQSDKRQAGTHGTASWHGAVAMTCNEHGYDANLQKLDPGPVFEAVSTGDLDLYLDVCLPPSMISKVMPNCLTARSPASNREPARPRSSRTS